MAGAERGAQAAQVGSEKAEFTFCYKCPREGIRNRIEQVKSRGNPTDLAAAKLAETVLLAAGCVANGPIQQQLEATEDEGPRTVSACGNPNTALAEDALSIADLATIVRPYSQAS